MKRKKIWEISHEYHCAIIGTCLSLAETENIFRIAGQILAKGMTDYQIHGIAVRQAKNYSRFTKKLNECLDKRHCAEIHAFSKCDNADELKTMWKAAFAERNIAGSFWALASHPHCHENLLNFAFGDVHMLSHITGASERTRLEELHKYQNEIKDLRSIIQNHQKETKEFKKTIRTLSQENSKLNERNITIESKMLNPHESRQSKIIPFEQNFIQESQKLRAKLALAEEREKQQRDEIRSLKEEIKSIQEAEVVLRDLVEIHCDKHCEDCQNDCEFAGNCDLKNKNVLLVGGRHASIPQYRSVIEIFNGNCFHHDGGVEQSMTVLKKLISRADIVICFLDCVSHSASKCVKQGINKKCQKILMLKNSGLSTFRRELEKQAV